jgi:Na+/proline symporter
LKLATVVLLLTALGFALDGGRVIEAAIIAVLSVIPMALLVIGLIFWRRS